MESRANAPTEETTYDRRDQKVIKMALRHRRMAASKSRASRGSGYCRGASRVDPGSVEADDVEEDPPAGRVYWDPARYI